MANETALPSRPLNFFYLKSSQFRVVHVDGAIGSITPRGLIHVAVWSERPAIPQVQVHDISPEGVLGQPRSSEGKEGVVRELEVDLMMTKQTATELRDWLATQIGELEKAEEKVRRGSGHA